jgi:hypothetical protein
MSIRVGAGRLIAVLLLALVAGCSRGPSQEARQCLAALDKAGFVFERADISPPSSGGCGIDGGVKLRQSTVALDQTATLSCALATAVIDFETRVVQPAAMHHFGQPVTMIRHFGAYACRASTGVRGRLSQHALGKAIDIRGFVLANGATVDVKTEWWGRGPAAAFLREIAREACRSFSLVLTPNSDRDHHDHIHLDLGPYQQCGA